MGREAFCHTVQTFCHMGAFSAGLPRKKELDEHLVHFKVERARGMHLLLCVPSAPARDSLQAVTTHPSAGRNRAIADSFHVSAHVSAAGTDVFRATRSHVSVEVRTIGRRRPPGGGDPEYIII